ncbi:hypothetical protein DRQ33_01850 [bacterium]|nr:MAG: hypothetical protein DRQ33_01850 [bacterium]
MPVLACKNVCFSYDNIPILKDITMSLSVGERIGLLGANGSGKTTLSLLMAGALKPQSGTVTCDGYSPFDEDKYIHFRKKIGYVFQNPEDGFVANDVVREIAFGGENFGIPADILSSRVDELLKYFELSKWSASSPLNLSGGMKTRLAIVSALVTGAQFFILDEPESFLDWKGQKLLRESLKKISNNVGIFHITQSAELARLCDKVYEIEDGIISPVDFDRLEEYIPSIKIKSNVGEEIISTIDNVSFAYETAPVLNNISMEINRGEIIGLLGESGSGKTTLALLLAGLLKPNTGKITNKGKTAMAFQFPERQLFAESVFKDVLFGPKNLSLQQPDEWARKSLNLMGIEQNLWERSPFELSDGQQRRVGLAGVIATNPDLLILDEPFATMDSEGIERIFSFIAKLAEKQVAIIIITHKTDLISKLAFRSVVLHDGKKVFDGNTIEILKDNEFCTDVGIKPLQ